MKMPMGVKMPPRPMGYPMPAGVKMPPRPAGVPPMGAYPPGTAVAQPPVPAAQYHEEPEVDENGYIDDLEDDLPDSSVPEKENESEENDDFEDNPYKDNMAADLGLPPLFIKTKMLFFLFVFFLCLGGGVGFLGGTLKNKAINSMPGVVQNAEIPKGRPRCGIAQKGQGCVLYIMNAQRQEVEGRDFFGAAADILKVPRFQIETANIRYSTMRIPPGYIALLNIPPMQ
jgi:hypothetical protein